MNNSTTKSSSRAIRLCALPLAALVSVSASAAANSWTQATEEVWKNDTNWAASVYQENVDFLKIFQTTTATTETTLHVLKIVTPSGLISINVADGFTPINVISGTQAGESVVKAVLTCLEKQTLPANTDQQFTSNRVIGTTEVNLTIISGITLNQNPLQSRADVIAKENIGRNLTGRLSGTSGTEFVATSFMTKDARSSLNAGAWAPVFSGGSFTNNSGGGTRSFIARTSRKSTGESFTEKLAANASTAQSLHDTLLTDDGKNSSSQSENFNVAPTYVTELGSVTNANTLGIATSFVQNDFLKAGPSRMRNTTDLANIGIAKQSGDNNVGNMVPTVYSIATGYQDVPVNHFTSTTTSFGSLALISQSSAASFDFSTISTVNSASRYAAATAVRSNTIADNTFSVTQLTSSPKIPTLRRALSATSAPGDKTSVAFSTDGLTLKDNTGAVLSAGTSANGDGMAVQIGYYSNASTGNNFSGTWIPLTGQNSVNSAYLSTSIGDEGALGGIPDGEYYSGDQLEFIEGSATRGNFPPSNTIPLSLRFYNAALISNATLYNTVSDDLWLWRTPGASSPIPPQVIMTLADVGLEWQGGIGSEFKTTLVIPEPTSALLLTLGAAGLLGRRRRRA
ncbi:MAG: PEP-CTERM sorting domain-containing protein [Verrucomicrobiota bacterium]